MSHGDRVLQLPPGFVVLGTSESSPFAAVRHAERPIWGVQFHPEVVHTEGGRQMLANFVHGICGCPGSWTMETFIEEETARIRERVGDGRAVCGLSGGASTPRWPRPWCTAPSATSSPASSWTTACCAWASGPRWRRSFARASACGW